MSSRRLEVNPGLPGRRPPFLTASFAGPEGDQAHLFLHGVTPADLRHAAAEMEEAEGRHAAALEMLADMRKTQVNSPAEHAAMDALEARTPICPLTAALDMVRPPSA